MPVVSATIENNLGVAGGIVVLTGVVTVVVLTGGTTVVFGNKSATKKLVGALFTISGRSPAFDDIDT